MRIFAIIVGLFVSLPAAAQTAEERLAALNTYMQRGFAALEIDWASSAASQSSRIASATEVSTSVKRALTPDLQASMLYPPLASNLVRLDEAIADARIANACAFARQQVADALAKRDEDVARRALEGMTATLKNLQSTKRMPTAVERFSADRKALEANIVLLAKALDRERTERARAEVDAKLKSEAEVRQRARIEAEQRLKLQADEKSRLAAEAKAKVEAEKATAEAARQQAAAQRVEKERLAQEERARSAALLADMKKKEADAREQAKAAEREAADEKARRAAEAKTQAAERVAEQKKKEADERLAAEEQRRRERDDPRRLLAAARQTRDDVIRALQTGTGPVPDKLLTAAFAAIGDLKRISPDQARTQDALLDVARLRSFARRPANTTPPAQGKSIRAVVSGAPSTIELWDAWCYVVAASSDVPLTVSIDSAVPLTRFAHVGMPEGQLGGWCTGGGGRATVRIVADTDARSVQLLGWPADAMPPGLLARARLLDVLPCNEQAMDVRWRGLVPGSVMFVADDAAAAAVKVNASPVLLVDPGLPDEPTVKVLGADGVEIQVLKAALRGTATPTPAVLNVPSSQCPELGPRLKELPDQSVCRAASDLAAAPAVARLVERLRSAPNDTDRAVAEQEIQVLDEEVTRRRQADCAPVEVSPARAWRTRQQSEVLNRVLRGRERATWLANEAMEGR